MPTLLIILLLIAGFYTAGWGMAILIVTIVNRFRTEAKPSL